MTTSGVCPVCGGPVAARPRGRPGVYCSRACQAKAYRARKAEGEGPMSARQAARLAAFHAALAIENALAGGWETLDRYGADRPRVEAALAELRAELERRAHGSRPRRGSKRDESAGVTEAGPEQRDHAAPAGPPRRRDETLEPVTESGAEEAAPAAGVGELYLARLHADDHLLLADGTRVGWLHTGPEGTRVHDAGGRLAATIEGRHKWIGIGAAAALGIPGAEDAKQVIGPPLDHLGRGLDLSPASLARWSLLRGRVPERQDVIVRGRCVGWLQRDGRGRHVACTVDGPVPGSASETAAGAVMALFAHLYAPAPLPDLPPEAHTARRAKARPSAERPISPYTPAELAAAAIDPPKRDGGGYTVIVAGDELGYVYRYRSRWQAATRTGSTVIHNATTRTEAIDHLLAVPGPLWGDPAGLLTHDLQEVTPNP